MSVDQLKQYAKFIVGLVGAVASAVLAVLGPDRVPAWVAVVVAVATAVGVYLTPNQPVA